MDKLLKEWEKKIPLIVKLLNGEADEAGIEKIPAREKRAFKRKLSITVAKSNGCGDWRENTRTRWLPYALWKLLSDESVQGLITELFSEKARFAMANSMVKTGFSTYMDRCSLRCYWNL